MPVIFVTSLIVVLGVGCATTTAGAQPAADAAETADAANHSREPSAAAPLSRDSSIDDILDALDARGRGLKTLAADVAMTESDPDTGDAFVRRGKVGLQINADGGARFRAMFDKRESNNRITEDRTEYVLDGPNLIDRTYRTKTQVTRQVLKPGEKLNLLKLGEGPFPLPIGQDKAEVHRAFDVTKPAPKLDDPADTVHVTLTPKPSSQFERKFKSIDVWVDVNDHMPKRIETLDPNGVTLRTTDLTNVKINAPLGDADFTMPKIDDSWTVLEEEYKK